MPEFNVPPESLRSSPDQQRAAAELLAASLARELTYGMLRDLGSVVVGRDLTSRSWRLCGWPKARPAEPTTGICAMARALWSATRTRRVRLGTRWVKSSAGEVAEDCVPAALPPAQFARWLRRACLAEIERDMTGLQRDRAAALDAPSRPDVGEFTVRIQVHPHVPAHLGGGLAACDATTAWTFMVRLGAHLTMRQRRLLAMLCDGDEEEPSNEELASKLGCCERTVRRDIGAMRERAMGLDVWFGSGVANSDQEVRKLCRFMTADEWEDRLAGYPASRYDRRRRPAPSRHLAHVTTKVAA